MNVTSNILTIFAISNVWIFVNTHTTVLQLKIVLNIVLMNLDLNTFVNTVHHGNTIQD